MEDGAKVAAGVGFEAHTRSVLVRVSLPEMEGKRLNVTLAAEQATKLSRLAERAHVPDGTLARSLLAAAIDAADPNPAGVTEILEGIPGAFEAAERGRAQAERGEGVPLS